MGFIQTSLNTNFSDLVKKEREEKQNSTILLFVLSPKTRNVVTMIEVAHLAAMKDTRLRVVFQTNEVSGTFNYLKRKRYHSIASFVSYIIG